jgi:hypothetical protein
MKNFEFYFTVFILIISLKPISAQNHNENNQKAHHEGFYPNTLGVFVGYTFIPTAISNEEKQSVIVPTIGLDYIYKFNHKFALGLQNDLELASYQVEISHNEILKREYAFVSALVFIYEPIEWWSVFIGPGYEFEHHESFYLTRIGTDFIKRFNDGWALSLVFTVDIKQVNTSPAIGITIFKGLGKTK